MNLFYGLGETLTVGTLEPRFDGEGDVEGGTVLSVGIDGRGVLVELDLVGATLLVLAFETM